MLRLALLTVLFASPAFAQTMYRWVDKSGHTHYTDDPTTAPKGAKVETTDGAPLTISNVAPEQPAPKNGKGKKQKEVDLDDENTWRARFTELKQNVARLKALVDKDSEPKKETASGNTDDTLNELSEMAFGPDPAVKAAKAAKSRREANQAELKRQQNALEELEAVADELKIPKEWRGD